MLYARQGRPHYFLWHAGVGAVDGGGQTATYVVRHEFYNEKRHSALCSAPALSRLCLPRPPPLLFHQPGSSGRSGWRVRTKPLFHRRTATVYRA